MPDPREERIARAIYRAMGYLAPWGRHPDRVLQCRQAAQAVIATEMGMPDLAPVAPGRTLAAELQAREMSANALALKLRVPANRLTEIIRGERAISAETALRLGRYFGTGATFWMNLQGNYDLALTEREIGARINREVEVA